MCHALAQRQAGRNMPTFQYKALQADGAMAEGRLEAAGRPDAFRQMEALGLRPVNLSEERSADEAPANGSALPVSLGKFR